MKKRNKTKQLQCVIGMSLILSLFGGMGPATAQASESITLEKTYQTDKSNDDGTGQFENTYEKNGILYGLSQIKTEIVETIPTAEEQYFWESAVFLDAAENHAPPVEVEKADGIYRLIKSEVLKGKTEKRSEYATSATVYKLEFTDNLASKGKVTVTDKDTGLEITKPLPLLSTEKVSSYWTDDFTFPITVFDYDAESFLLGSVVVPADAELIDYADELLNHVGLPSQYYQITEISWAGSVYEQSDMQMRDAVATGRKLITEVKAVYGGDIDLPALEGEYYKCTYAKDETTTGMAYKVKAVATYELEKDVVHKSFLEWLLDWILQHPIAAIGIALLLIVLLVIIVLFVLAKKEGEEEKNDVSFVFEDEQEEEG